MSSTVTVRSYDNLLRCLTAYHTPRHLISFEIEPKGVLAEITQKKGENHD